MNTQALESYSRCVQQDMQKWLERAVIGLNLCPFAKAVHVKGLIRYAVCLDEEPEKVLNVLSAELQKLADASPGALETSLLILPCCFEDFLEFTEFVKRVDRMVADLDLEGVLQVASFHPDFQFSGSDVNDIANFTNRSPYPTLHLLRESSIDQAVEVFPKAESIFEKNIETLNSLGHSGWIDLDLGRHAANLSKGRV